MNCWRVFADSSEQCHRWAPTILWGLLSGAQPDPTVIIRNSLRLPTGKEEKEPSWNIPELPNCSARPALREEYLTGAQPVAYYQSLTDPRKGDIQPQLGLAFCIGSGKFPIPVHSNHPLTFKAKVRETFVKFLAQIHTDSLKDWNLIIKLWFCIFNNEKKWL